MYNPAQGPWLNVTNDNTIDNSFEGARPCALGLYGLNGNVESAQMHASSRKTETLIRSRIGMAQQSALAAALDVQPSTVGRWLSGECNIPLTRLGPLLDALNLVILPTEEVQALRLFAERGVSADHT